MVLLPDISTSPAELTKYRDISIVSGKPRRRRRKKQHKPIPEPTQRTPRPSTQSFINPTNLTEARNLFMSRPNTNPVFTYSSLRYEHRNSLMSHSSVAVVRQNG